MKNYFLENVIDELQRRAINPDKEKVKCFLNNRNIISNNTLLNFYGWKSNPFNQLAREYVKEVLND